MPKHYPGGPKRYEPAEYSVSDAVNLLNLLIAYGQLEDREAIAFRVTRNQLKRLADHNIRKIGFAHFMKIQDL